MPSLEADGMHINTVFQFTIEARAFLHTGSSITLLQACGNFRRLRLQILAPQPSADITKVVFPRCAQ